MARALAMDDPPFELKSRSPINVERIISKALVDAALTAICSFHHLITTPKEKRTLSAHLLPNPRSFLLLRKIGL